MRKRDALEEGTACSARGETAEQLPRERGPLRRLLLEQGGGRRTLEPGVELEERDRVLGLLGGSRNREHELARAAESPALEIAPEFRRESSQLRTVERRDEFTRGGASQERHELRVVAHPPRKIPELRDRRVARKIRKALEQGVVQRRLLLARERAADREPKEPVAHHRRGIGERRVVPAVQPDVEKVAHRVAQSLDRQRPQGLRRIAVAEPVDGRLEAPDPRADPCVLPENFKRHPQPFEEAREKPQARQRGRRWEIARAGEIVEEAREPRAARHQMQERVDVGEGCSRACPVACR
jgi:hypothetical protein